MALASLTSCANATVDLNISMTSPNVPPYAPPHATPSPSLTRSVAPLLPAAPDELVAQ